MTTILTDKTQVKPGQLYHSHDKHIVVLGLEDSKITVLHNSALPSLNTLALVTEPILSNKYQECTFDDYLDILQSHYGDKLPPAYKTTVRKEIPAGGWWHCSGSGLFKNCPIFLKLGDGRDLPLFNSSHKTFVQHSDGFSVTQISPLEMLRVYRPATATKPDSKLTEPASESTKLDKSTLGQLTFGELPVGSLYMCSPSDQYIRFKTSATNYIAVLTDPFKVVVQHVWPASSPVYMVPREHFYRLIEQLKTAKKQPAGPLKSFAVGTILTFKDSSFWHIKVDDTTIAAFNNLLTNGWVQIPFSKDNDISWEAVYRTEQTKQPTYQETAAANLQAIPNYTWFTFDKPYKPTDHKSLYLRVDSQVVYIGSKGICGFENPDKIRPATKEEILESLRIYKQGYRKPDGKFAEFKPGELIVNQKKWVGIKVDDTHIIWIDGDGAYVGDKLRADTTYVFSHISGYDKADKPTEPAVAVTPAKAEVFSSSLPNNTLWYPADLTEFELTSVRLKLNHGESIYPFTRSIASDIPARQLTQDEVDRFITWYEPCLASVERPSRGLFGEYQLGDIIVGCSGKYIKTGPKTVIILKNQTVCHGMKTEGFMYEWVGRAAPEKSKQVEKALVTSKPERKRWSLSRIFG